MSFEFGYLIRPLGSPGAALVANLFGMFYFILFFFVFQVFFLQDGLIFFISGFKVAVCFLFVFYLFAEVHLPLKSLVAKKEKTKKTSLLHHTVLEFAPRTFFCQWIKASD